MEALGGFQVVRWGRWGHCCNNIRRTLGPRWAAASSMPECREQGYASLVLSKHPVYCTTNDHGVDPDT